MEDTNEIIEKSIKVLAEKAGQEGNALNPIELMQLSQAALNLAQVLRIRNNM